MKMLKDYEKIVIEAKIPTTSKGKRLLYGKQSEINFIYAANDRGLNVIFNNEVNIFDIDCLQAESNTYIEVKRRSTYEINNEEYLYVEKSSVDRYLEDIEKLPNRYDYECILAFDISKDSNNINFVFIEIKYLIRLKERHEALEINDCIYFPISKTKSFNFFVKYINDKKNKIEDVNGYKLERMLEEININDANPYEIKKLSYYSSIITTKNVAFWLNKVRKPKNNTLIDERLTSENCMIFSKKEFDDILKIYNNGKEKTDLWICFDIKHQTLKNELRFLKFDELLYNFKKEIKPSVWVQSNGLWMNSLKTDCITEMEFNQKYIKKYFNIKGDK